MATRTHPTQPVITYVEVVDPRVQAPRVRGVVLGAVHILAFGEPSVCREGAHSTPAFVEVQRAQGRRRVVLVARSIYVTGVNLAIHRQLLVHLCSSVCGTGTDACRGFLELLRTSGAHDHGAQLNTTYHNKQPPNRTVATRRQVCQIEIPPSKLSQPRGSVQQAVYGWRGSNHLRMRARMQQRESPMSPRGRRHGRHSNPGSGGLYDARYESIPRFTASSQPRILSRAASGTTWNTHSLDTACSSRRDTARTRGGFLARDS